MFFSDLFKSTLPDNLAMPVRSSLSIKIRPSIICRTNVAMLGFAKMDIFIFNLKSEKITNLTSTGVAESNPMWSGDGKYIYFSTNRTQPTYPTGGGASHIYRFALDRTDAPFRTDEFDKLWKKDSTVTKKDTTSDKKDVTASKKDTAASKKEAVVPITINTDRIWERFEMISPGFGSQGSPYVIQKGDKTTVLY